MPRYCPVCGVRPIFRREVHTCGGPSCIATWRSWNYPTKAAAVENSAGETDLPVGKQELEEWLKGNKPVEEVSNPLESILGKKKE